MELADAQSPPTQEVQSISASGPQPAAGDAQSAAGQQSAFGAASAPHPVVGAMPGPAQSEAAATCRPPAATAPLVGRVRKIVDVAEEARDKGLTCPAILGYVRQTGRQKRKQHTSKAQDRQRRRGWRDLRQGVQARARKRHFVVDRSSRQRPRRKTQDCHGRKRTLEGNKGLKGAAFAAAGKCDFLCVFLEALQQAAVI